MLRLRWILFTLVLSMAGATTPADPSSVEIQELKLAIKESNLKLASRVTALERDRIILAGVLGLNILAIPLAYLRLLRRADKLAKKRLQEIIESRPTELTNLLDEHDAERRLRQETRVTIVSNTLELEGVLRQHGFKNLVTKKSSELEGTLAESAVVLDLVHGIDEQQAAEAIASHNLDHVLAFSYERASLPQGKATFANSHMTLFSRLLELLKFKDAAERG